MRCRLTETAANGTGWIIAIAILSIIVGCSGTEVGNPDTTITPTSSNIEPLASDEELETYLKDQYAKSVNVGSSGLNVVPEDGDGNSPNADDNGTAPTTDGFTRTNIQEAGVDESDVVKIDGAYFYIAGAQSFNVVDITEEMEVVATQAVDGYVDSLYLHENKLVVLYGSAETGGGRWDDITIPTGGRLFGMPYWIPVKKRQGVAVFDISDPRSPTQLKTVEFDGHMVSSRLISGKLHIVQQFRPELPPLDFWYDGTARDLENKITSNQEAIDEMKLAQLIPYYRVVSDPQGSQQEGPTVATNHFYCPVNKDGGGTITTIVTFDLDESTLPFESIGMVADAHIVYASPRALYTATHKYIYDIKTTNASEETILYKFDLTGQSVEFTGGGVIPGWILNQFSLGEHQDVLRVATTNGHAGGWQESARNNVYCLRLEKETLKIIGKIENLAPDEQIYSARFMGERGYLVTYFNIDPLFTLNLSDPAAPKVAGYLKVPGYSDYIHPYGDNYLITVGKDALLVEEDNMAWYQGVQLSIFDVSDFSNPSLLHKEIIGDRGTNTQVSTNHKAFAFWADNGLLALPIDLFEHATDPAHPSSHGEKTFEGLYVYQVSTDGGFDLLGRIDTESDPADAISYSPWTRGRFVDQQVYAVTNNAVRSARIDQIEESIQTLYLE